MAIDPVDPQVLPAPALLPPESLDRLRRFVAASRFRTEGGVVTDLDGTAVHERDGRVYVAEPVLEALKTLAAQGRPVVLNTLRFPLNVIRTFGQVWSEISAHPLPLVSLNGAAIGLLKPAGTGETAFEAVASFPIPAHLLEDVVKGLRPLLDAGEREIVLFHYAQDWRLGETIWTPAPERIETLRAKYLNASSVISTSLAELRDILVSQNACMLSVLVDVPEDRRMAYQHASPSRFVSAPRVDKLFGAQEAARRLGFDLAQSVGAGDTPMDCFLRGVGLAFHVGPAALADRGLHETVRLHDPLELGAALAALADLSRTAA